MAGLRLSTSLANLKPRPPTQASQDPLQASTEHGQRQVAHNSCKLLFANHRGVLNTIDLTATELTNTNNPKVRASPGGSDFGRILIGQASKSGLRPAFSRPEGRF